jgi:protein PhnA
MRCGGRDWACGWGVGVLDPRVTHWQEARLSDDVKDSNGNILKDGDSVHVIKDLKLKGAGETLKRGTLIKNIRLTGNPGEIEGRTSTIKGLVLKTEFLKKA